MILAQGHQTKISSSTDPLLISLLTRASRRHRGFDKRVGRRFVSTSTGLLKSTLSAGRKSSSKAFKSGSFAAIDSLIVVVDVAVVVAFVVAQ